jgi:WD40 repeat protein
MYRIIQLLILFYSFHIFCNAQNQDYLVHDTDLKSPVTSLRVSPDGQLLFAGDQNGILHLFSTETYEEQTSMQASPGAGILDIEITPSQDVVFLATGHLIRLFDYQLNPIINWTVHNTTIWSMDLDPTGTRLVSAEMNKTFQLWDVFNGEVIESMRAHEEPALAVAFSPDGKYIASGSNDRQVLLWDASKREVIASFQGLSDNIYAVEFSPDGSLLAACSKDHSVRIWQVEERKLIHVLKGHRDMVMEIEFSPDGQYLLSASADFTIKLWDVKTGEQVFAFVENEAAVLDVCFLPGGQYFASASMDDHLKIRQLHPEIFVLKYYGEAYREEMAKDPLFLPRKKGEKKSEYTDRMEQAGERKATLINKYYAKYLSDRQ